MGKGILLVAVCCLAVSVPVLAQSGGGYDLTWSTIDGGGGMSTGGGYELTGTIGQPDATSRDQLSGGGYTLTGGFWSAVGPACTAFAPVDFDHDCDVDLADLDLFSPCVSGPTVAHNGSATCQTADLDGDGDVDHSDFGVFQQCYSGTLVADPDCAN